MVFVQSIDPEVIRFPTHDDLRHPHPDIAPEEDHHDQQITEPGRFITMERKGEISLGRVGGLLMIHPEVL
jgi:hypothetical protein